MEARHQKIILDNIKILVEKTQNYSKIVELLLDEDVVTKKQMNYIETNFEEDAKKIEELYLLITKRGPNAFRHLYNIFFKSGNPELSFVISPNRSSNTETHIVDRDGYDISEVYKLEGNPKGKVLIVNIESIPKEGMIRYGSPKDVEELKKVWTDLGHEVEPHVNLNKNQFEDTFTKFIQSFSGDCFTLFLMSHGQQDKNKDENVLVQMHDASFVESDWIIAQLTTTKAPHLADVPKLIFVVSCRGYKSDFGVDLDKARELSGGLLNKNTAIDGVPRNNFRPIISNLIMIYPCSPGFVSHRNINYGTWFVQELVNVITHYADKETLEDMIKRVDRLLLNGSIFHKEGFQTVNIKSVGFNKKLFLKPQRSTK